MRRETVYISPATRKQIHMDMIRMIDRYIRGLVSGIALLRYMRRRGFTETEVWTIVREYETLKLEKKSAIFIRKGRRWIKLEILRIILTFSIETGGGKEPLYCEVTADTSISGLLSREKVKEIAMRIVNAVLKLFYVVFDVNKDFPKDLWEIYREIGSRIKHVRALLKKQGTIHESLLDFILTGIEHVTGVLTRPFEEYAVTMKILKIGVEYAEAKQIVYPRVRVQIEKRGKYPFTAKCYLIIADRSLFDMVGRTAMALELEVI